MKGRTVWFGIVATVVILAVPLTVSAETSRSYSNVTFLLLSKGYSVLNISGFHERNSGQGHDDIITLHGHRLGFHLFIIQSSTGKIREGCIYTKVDFLNFDGWMFGKSHVTLLDKTPLKMFGRCERITITVYRG
jgi:hypothetical protein